MAFVQGSDWSCDRDVIWSVRYGQSHFQYPHPPGHTDPGKLASSNARNAYCLGHSYTKKNKSCVRGMGRGNLTNSISERHPLTYTEVWTAISAMYSVIPRPCGSMLFRIPVWPGNEAMFCSEAYWLICACCLLETLAHGPHDGVHGDVLSFLNLLLSGCGTNGRWPCMYRLEVLMEWHSHLVSIYSKLFPKCQTVNGNKTLRPKFL